MKFFGSKHHRDAERTIEIGTVFGMGLSLLTSKLVRPFGAYFVAVLQERAAESGNLPEAEAYQNAARYLQAVIE